MSKSLAEMAEEIYEVNVTNGWYKEDRSIGDDIALLHSEVSEMFEAWRDTGLSDQTDGDEHCGRCGIGRAEHDVYFASTSTARDAHDFALPKPEGWGSECADVLIRLLDTCRRTGVDLNYEYERKLAYNRTRGWRHGGKRV